MFHTHMRSILGGSVPSRAFHTRTKMFRGLSARDIPTTQVKETRFKYTRTKSTDTRTVIGYQYDKYRGLSAMDIPSTPFEETSTVKYTKTKPTPRTVLGYQCARVPKVQELPDNNSSLNYLSNRLNFERSAANQKSDIRATASATTAYRSGRSKATEETREGRLLMLRLMQGELFGQADREVLLKFAKTKQGSSDVSQFFTDVGSHSGKADDVVAAVIHLVKGRVVELACDGEFGPCFVLNGLELECKAYGHGGDRRIHDAMISEFFALKENVLISAFTKTGQVLIKSILEKGNAEEREFVLNAIKGNMSALRLDRWGRFVVKHAHECLPAELWKPLADELVAYDSFPQKRE